ncbi:DUF4235 domain-containing protein [Arthrobacter glacialis]|uniref:DUF4235 domain-containing protein n=1 Tax=Arthrobacter glacialis TaxID=1664 RepID=A0A2S3ZUZ6_ARTGL|nr:DUF4235 domain-containing protein [Arthrobacter glacialis]POH57877.1 hypothetical protein CVS28_14010 [Arthrobacter glacialis]POH72677.1 hypothetical protein CVS27_15015 [Arthrobacter glacialis]
MNILIKLLSVLASVAAGAVARKALAAGWRKSTGSEPPKDAGDPRNSLPGVLVFALVTAASGAIIHVLTQRWGRKATLRLEQTPGEV